MQIRKKEELDGIDKEILRAIYYKKRPLVGFQIAKIVGLTPSAITPRLVSLLSHGILKKERVSGIRKFKRKFGNSFVTVKSHRSIYWGLDLK
jgi:DNA-binding Lrp family transcriptional regulator